MSDPAKVLLTLSEAANELGTWEDEIALDALRMYRGLPAAIEDVANAIRRVALNLSDDHAYKRSSTQAMEDLGAYMLTCSEFAEEARDTFENDHAENIERILNPAPGAIKWDVTRNQELGRYGRSDRGPYQPGERGCLGRGREDRLPDRQGRQGDAQRRPRAGRGVRPDPAGCRLAAGHQRKAGAQHPSRRSGRSGWFAWSGPVRDRWLGGPGGT